MLSDDQAEEYLAKLERSNPDKIRHQLAMNQLDARKRELALMWLAQRQAKEQSSIMRSSKNAAWAAAVAAALAALATVAVAVFTYQGMK